MGAYLRMQHQDLTGKRVLIRLDLNVPIREGKITSDARITASLPTIEMAIQAGAKVMLLSHLGRPTEGVYESLSSLAPVARALSERLLQPVPLIKDWLNVPPKIENGSVVLLENVRFNLGEAANDDALSRQMAQLCDIFVMDAFGTAHRAQASTCGVARFAPVVCAGPLLTKELDALGKALREPKRPLVAIVGGSKVSTKLTLLESLSKKVDHLIVGGGIANTFIKARGFNVGLSLYEPDLVSTAKRLHDELAKKGAGIPEFVDVVCAKQFSADAPATCKPIDCVEPDDMILDLGPQSVEHIRAQLSNAKTIIWNGPLGVFEYDPFANGTRVLSQAVAESEAFSIAGGGDTIAAINAFGVSDRISYISTGGGAFLEYLEGQTLPAVKQLEARMITN